MFADRNDTIAAVSTAPGRSLRGMVRLSGPQAVALAARVFTANSMPGLEERAGHSRSFGRLRIEAAGSVPAEAYLFRAPASYTRQDVVELHTVGSPPLLAEVLEQLLTCGARQAEPGEFTARAFFSGALDLTEVEGVAAVIHARTDAQLRASEALLHGALSRRTHAFREELADLLALVEAEIDFVEEAMQFVVREALTEALERIAGGLLTLLEHAPSVERLEMLPHVALVGAPNAGKSTLLNRLCGMDRAIQAATAGTTRDVLGVPLEVPGGEVMLLDTAGFEVAGAQVHASAPGRLAQRATERCIASADLLLLVVDGTRCPLRDLQELSARLPRTPHLLVVNKLDAMSEDLRKDVFSALKPPIPPLAVSALTGEGTDVLRNAIGRGLFHADAAHSSEMIALSSRQCAALRDAHTAIERARELVARDEGAAHGEFIALELREATHALSLLVGEVTTEDLLGRIFSRFCIGK